MDDLILQILKMDLQIMTDKLDSYLYTLIAAAAQYITEEGITLKNTEGDAIIQAMYAAYLYRRRKSNDQPPGMPRGRKSNDQPPGMPRMLRYALNNRLFSQKMKEPEEGEPSG